MVEQIVELRDVQIWNRETMVLNQVDFALAQAEFCYIIGRTGSGKSSLLQSIYGALPIKHGKATIAGFDAKQLNKDSMYKLRRSLGMVFQQFELFNDLSVHANLQYVLQATDWKDQSAMTKRITEVLEQVDMKTVGNTQVSELSGGEQQRIAIARSILNRPTLLLADEPTGNLDPQSSDDILYLIKRITETYQMATIFATHDVRIIDKFPARTLSCERGKLIEK